MTLFIGGPYDGQNLPVETGQARVRLPNPDELSEFDPQATANNHWRHIYTVDYSGSEPHFRYVGEDE